MTASQRWKQIKTDPVKHKELNVKRRAYWKNNPEKYKAHKIQKRLDWKNFCNEIYTAYGNKCWCCGESNPGFFTIDHVNNDGAKHRHRSSKNKKDRVNNAKIFREIKRAGFPDTFRLMCFNCNCGRQRNGGICPHANDLM